MRRLFTSLTLGIFALIVLAAPVGAGSRVWCARDPIVNIDGTPVQIWIAVPDEYADYVSDKIQVKIKTPKDVARQVLFLDEGFNGHGEEVKWGDIKDENPSDGQTPMEVEVKVKFDKKRLEKAHGKDRLEADLGKEMEIPVMVTVNVGEMTHTYETHVIYGVHKKTKFNLSVVGDSDVE
jgi:hypothetical protein